MRLFVNMESHVPRLLRPLVRFGRLPLLQTPTLRPLRLLRGQLFDRSSARAVLIVLLPEDRPKIPLYIEFYLLQKGS